MKTQSQYGNNISVKAINAFIYPLMGVWLLHFIIYVITPYHSTVGTHYALFYQLLYVFIVISVLYIFKRFTFTANYPDRSGSENSSLSNDLHFPVSLLVIVTMIIIAGLFFNLYDKIAIRGYSYFPYCADHIRETWLADGVKRNGEISSWQNVLGYILTFFSVPLLLILFIGHRSIAKRYYVVFTLISIVATYILAFTIASRSVILFYFACFLSIFLLYYVLGNRSIRSAINAKRIILVSLVIVSFGSAYYLFWNKLDCLQISDNDSYITGYYDQLGITQTDLNKSGNVKGTSRFKTVFSVISIYVNNGTWNFEHSLAADDTPGYSFFSFILSWTKKLGLPIRTDDIMPTYKNGMISLPGALWYDLGSIGFVVAAIVHGLFMAGICASLTKKGLLFYFGVICFIFISVLNLLSPLSPAVNLLAAPFVGFALLCFMIIAFSITYKKKCLYQEFSRLS